MGSLISVFLAGLSAGYYFGGRLADSNPSSKKLGIMIIVPGVLFLSFPLYSPPISDWIFMKDLGVRISPLLASTALFLLPSVFLGIVSPYTAKLMICSLHTSGKQWNSLCALHLRQHHWNIPYLFLSDCHCWSPMPWKSWQRGDSRLLSAIPLLFMGLQYKVGQPEAALRRKKAE